MRNNSLPNKQTDIRGNSATKAQPSKQDRLEIVEDLPRQSASTFGRETLDPRYCAVLAASTVDALEGRRHIETLRRWYPTLLFAMLRRKSQEYSRLNQANRASLICRALKVSILTINAVHAEVAVTIVSGKRIRAVAMSLKQVRNKWVVTAFETDW